MRMGVWQRTFRIEMDKMGIWMQIIFNGNEWNECLDINQFEWK